MSDLPIWGELRVRCIEAQYDEEYLAGVCCLAVPVRDADQRVVAAISVQAPVTRMRLEEMVEFLPHLRQAADAVAQTIDW
jgi:DNA-binding IclR family transcriptional regulator